jgi:DNA anti-recombination protein RmuC
MDYDPNLEARVVRLETAMESVQSDIREIKTELRLFRAEVKGEFANLRKEFDEKFDAFRKEFDGKLESFRKEFNDKLEANRRESKGDLLKLAALLVSAMLGLAGMMARGFGWI